MLVVVFSALYAGLSVGLTRVFKLPWQVRVPLVPAVVVAGVFFLLLGTSLLIWSFKSLGAGRAVGKELFLPASQSKLVTSGIYAYTRNPLYLSVTIIFLGWFFALRLTPAAILTVLFFVHFLLVAKWEERELGKRFGREYEEYRKRVPFLVPLATGRRRGRLAGRKTPDAGRKTTGN